jgi:hypothetical protein
MQLEALFEGMGAGPVVAAGAALGILLGVAGGTAIDTSPLQRGKTFEQLIPERQLASFDRAGDAPSAYLPDHYPQETRNGRIEVPELRSYILRHERPADFVYSDGLDPPDGDTEAAAPDPLESDTEDRPVPPNLRLSGTRVPGRLEQAALPIANDVLLEPATVNHSRTDSAAAL